MKKHVLVLLFLFTGFFLNAQKAPLLNAALAHKVEHAQSLGFRKNLGQIESPTFPHQIFYAMKTPGLDLYITEKGLTYFFYKVNDVTGSGGLDDEAKGIPLSWERMEMLLDHATIDPKNIVEISKSQTSYNYFTPSFPDGLYHVPEYRELLIKNVYVGIDWHLYFTEEGKLKYDFIVHAGADASQIRLNYLSPKGLNISKQGNLEIKAADHHLTEQAPYSYLKHSAQTVASSFILETENVMSNCIQSSVTFKLDHYKETEDLIIDPTLYWSTAFGGSFNDRMQGIATDIHGNIYITGFTQSTDFILQNAGTYFQGTGNSSGKAVIMKFNSKLALVWSTFYGGSNGSDQGMCITLDKSQQIYISGNSYSSDFPLQNNGGYFQNTLAGGNADAFVLKFDTSGVRKWATYYGGSGLEFGSTITTDQRGAVYIGGITYSNNFPLMNAGTFFYGTAPQQGNDCGYIVKFDSTGNRQWATYYQCDRISALSTDLENHLLTTGFTYNTTHTLNPGGGAYFQNAPGYQAFVSRFTESGALTWATYYGGNQDDWGKSIITDRHANIFIAGVTRSTNMPLVGDENAYQYAAPSSTLPTNTVDCFIAKFDSSGVLTWATNYGAGGYEEMNTAQNLALDACDRLYFALESSPGFTSLISTQSACEGGYLKTTGINYDQHIARFTNNGAREWATLIGGDGPDQGSAICIDHNGDLYMTGNWDPSSSSTYTYVNPGGGASYSTNPGNASQAFVVKFVGAVQNSNPQFSYPIICSNLTSSILPQTTNSFVPGGHYNCANPNLNINEISGLITVTGVPPGNYEVTYNSQSCICSKSKLIVSIQDCSGIIENQSKILDFELFPNPSNGQVVLKYSKTQSVLIMNALGQVLKKIDLESAGTFEINLPDLAEGVYFLQSTIPGANSKKLIIAK